MSSNVQALCTFDHMDIAAESGCVSEPEDTFRELLFSFIADLNYSAG